MSLRLHNLFQSPVHAAMQTFKGGGAAAYWRRDMAQHVVHGDVLERAGRWVETLTALPMRLNEEPLFGNTLAALVARDSAGTETEPEAVQPRSRANMRKPTFRMKPRIGTPDIISRLWPRQPSILDREGSQSTTKKGAQSTPLATIHSTLPQSTFSYPPLTEGKAPQFVTGGTVESGYSQTQIKNRARKSSTQQSADIPNLAALPPCAPAELLSRWAESEQYLETAPETGPERRNQPRGGERQQARKSEGSLASDSSPQNAAVGSVSRLFQEGRPTRPSKRAFIWPGEFTHHTGIVARTNPPNLPVPPTEAVAPSQALIHRTKHKFYRYHAASGAIVSQQDGFLAQQWSDSLAGPTAPEELLQQWVTFMPPERGSTSEHQRGFEPTRSDRLSSPNEAKETQEKARAHAGAKPMPLPPKRSSLLDLLRNTEEGEKTNFPLPPFEEINRVASAMQVPPVTPVVTEDASASPILSRPLPPLTPPQTIGEPVPPVASAMARQGARVEALPGEDLTALADKIQRILQEEARRHGINV